MKEHFQTQGSTFREQLRWEQWQLQTALRAEFYKAGDEKDGGSITHVNKLMPSIGVTYSAFKNVNIMLFIMKVSTRLNHLL